MQYTLKEKLRALGEAVNEVTEHTIDFGGCAVYAALVARELEKLGIQARGVVCSPYGGNVDEARNNVTDAGSVEEWNAQGIVFRHVALEAEIDGDRVLFDSRYMTDAAGGALSRMTAIPGYLTVAELESLAGLTGDERETHRHPAWNDDFDRGQIPALREVVGMLPTVPEDLT